MINVLSVIHDSIVDGDGLRTTIFFAGCPHQCRGCHNPTSWSFDNGERHSIDDLLELVAAAPLNDVTFSGGEPFQQAKEISLLAKQIKAMGKNLWCYTGYTYEWIIKQGNEDQKNLLSYIDTLVDGPFILELRDTTLSFRGSNNQRIMNLKEQ